MLTSDRVQFNLPNLGRLGRSHTLVDMHFHSIYSDGRNPIDKIADRARRLGIGIAITDHNEIRGALEIDRHSDILTIPGIELTAAEGSHLLAYFYETKELQRFFEVEVVPRMGHGVMSSLSLNMYDIIERAQAYQCLIVFAHPYCAMYTGVCNLQFSDEQRHLLFQMVDGVEVLNANNLNRWNLRCAILGFNLGKAMTGGSDGHCLNHMGRAVTFADCPGTRYDFLDAVALQHSRVIGKEVPFLRKVTANSLKLRSNLSNCPDLLEKNIRYGRKVINFKSRALRRRIEHHINADRLKSYLGM
ncbi:MAG: PHP domain-containing protein [Desulfatitalea sp.]|nr:PHP domain-containing protein [Desulfatitalea sp.]NNK01488.1 PHP domain-containing protein [Desulfatitalea sp.]